MTDTTAESRDTVLAGIIIMLVGLCTAALNGAVMKSLTPHLPEVQIVWGRYLAYFAIMLPIALARHGLATFTPPAPARQIVRALLLVVSTVAFAAGVAELRFADAIAILYVYPFVLTLLSPWMLGEKVPRAAWFGVVGGFIGVLIVMRPDPASFNYHALLVFICGTVLAVHLAFTRQLALTTSPVITSTYTAFVCLVTLSLAVPFFWEPVPTDLLWRFGVLGITSAASHGLILMAFARAPAPVLAPFAYGEIVAAVGIGFAIFGNLPDMIAWAGIAVIIASGLIVARAPARIGLPLSRRRPPAP